MVVSDPLSFQRHISNDAVLRTGLKNLEEPCFEEPPWTNGQLKVIAEPITDAIQWLAAQLQHEADARKSLESKFEANLETLRPCPESWVGDSDRIDKFEDSSGSKVEDSSDLRGIVERLRRDMQRLQYEQGQQKKQQEEKLKVSDGLAKLRLEALSREIQARPTQDDVAKQINALRLDVKTIAAAAGQNAAEAALADSVASLHSQLDGVCTALQAQMDSLQARYGDLAKQMDVFGDEIATLRTARAFDHATSMVTTPTSSSVSPEDALERTESLGTKLEACKSSKADLAPELVVPVWQDRQEHVDSQVNANEGIDKAKLAQNGTGSRRPSACSTVGTIGGTDSAHKRGEVLSRDTDSSFGKPITPDGCMAWVEERIDELRAEIMELKKLVAHAQDVSVAYSSHPDIHEKNADSSSGHETSDDLQHKTRSAMEEEQNDSSGMMNDKFCEQLKDWLRQNLQELLDQMHGRSLSQQPVSSQSVDTISSKSHQLDGVCEPVLGDVGGSSTSEASAAYERWSATREEIASVLKDEMKGWLEEQQNLILQEIRKNVDQKHEPTLLGDPSLNGSKSEAVATPLKIEELEEIGLAKEGHANLNFSNVNGDMDAMLSAIEKRLQALEITGLAKARHADVATLADLAVTKEGLRRMDQRIEALEHDKSNGSLPCEIDNMKKMARQSTGSVKPKRSVGEVSWDEADIRREIANISQAVKGTQRSFDLTASKIEDLSSAQKILKSQVDASLPHVVQALQTLAQHVGFDMSGSIHSPSDQNGCSGKPNTLSLHELITSDHVPNLFVSPEMLSQAVNSLGNDLHTSLNRLQRDIKDAIKSKTDSQEFQNLAMKLEDMEQSLPAYFMQFTQPEEEGVENPAGVRWPLQPARCISCNAKADFVAPWGNKVVPKFPWPLRQQLPNSKANSNRAMQSSPPPSRGRRRETSLPSIERDGNNSKYQ